MIQRISPSSSLTCTLTDEFHFARFFSHCEGLVLVPTDTKAYLFNPATRDIVTLPESGHGNFPPSQRPIGLGRDLRSGIYKVVQFFVRFRDNKFYNRVEVCTVGDHAPPRWREITADRWYHADPWVAVQSVNGGVYWIVNANDCTDMAPHPHFLLRFGLDVEALSVTHLPSDLSDLKIDNGNKDIEHLNLSVLHGELCLTGYRVNETSDLYRLVMVWALVEDGASSMWEPRYTLHDMGKCHPIALLPGTLMLRSDVKLCLYDLQSHERTNACELSRLRYRGHGSDELEPAWKDVYFFNVIPYTESIVPVGAHRASTSPRAGVPACMNGGD